jgi:hypothetical protein
MGSSGSALARLAAALLILGCSRSELELPEAVRNAPPSAPPFGRSPEQAVADRIDLLLVIDDSGSMIDKQQLLADALPDLVERLTHPACVDSSGAAIAAQPPRRTDPCPPGSGREFNPVQDMHIGVITTSVGNGANCFDTFGQSTNGRLHVSGTIPTYEGRGFLVFDPNGVNRPRGIADPAELSQRLRNLVHVGSRGCGLEAPLESLYRFLVEPAPALTGGICAAGAPCALDRVLLTQRAAFLRPDSLLAILVLTDENDCSLRVDPRIEAFLDRNARAPRGTSACSVAPGHVCCRPCGAPAPPECVDSALDPACAAPLTPEEDPPLLRCWDQKRRFGVDYVHPIERYVRGLRERTIDDGTGRFVTNPIFADLQGQGAPPRDPSLVFLGTIVGVPYQTLADPDARDELRYLGGQALEERGIWDALLGRPELDIPPTEPFMVESVRERSGTSPITGESIAPSSSPNRWANAVNGHEMSFAVELADPLFSDLQYACIFDLPSMINCTEGDPNCDCSTEPGGARRPICQQPEGRYSRIQWGGKAYPGSRPLQVVRELGDQGIAASICARNVRDRTRADYGYRPALRAILDRLRFGLR